MIDIKELLEGIEEKTLVELKEILEEDCWSSEDTMKVKNLMKTMWYSMSIKKGMGIPTGYNPSPKEEVKKANV